MLFKQFFDHDTYTFTYLLGCPESKEALLIDPVIAHTDLYLKFLKEYGLTLKYSLDTHTHADHITGAAKLKKATGCEIVMGKHSKAECVDRKLEHNETLSMGNLTITALHTPGHTDESYCYYSDGKLFTGDTLLIRGSGRTDFQNGDARKQYKSITEILFKYPDDTLVYPCHDYKVVNVSTIGEEKRFNPRLNIANIDEYEKLMNNLNLDMPRYIKQAVPANLRCGNTEDK